METAGFKINGQEILVTLRDEADASVAAEIFKLHEYRIAETVLQNTTLPIVDVGGHAGFFTLYARALNQTAPIIVIEPEPQNLQALQTHLEQNKITDVTVIASVLAATTQDRELYVSADSHNHSLIKDQKYPAVRTVSVASIDFAHLQTLTPQGIGLLKMDIEGGEYEIFAQLKPEQFAHIHALVMEYHDLPNHKHQEIERQLRESGFGVQIFPSKFDKTMGFLWATNKRL